MSARQAVAKIVADLTDRKGLSGAWDSIDDDIRDEIRAGWEDIIAAEIAGEMQAERDAAIAERGGYLALVRPVRKAVRR